MAIKSVLFRCHYHIAVAVMECFFRLLFMFLCLLLKVFWSKDVQNDYFRISLGTILSEELLFNTWFSLTWKFIVLICGCIVIYLSTNRFLWEFQLNLFDPRLLQNTWIRRNAGPKVFFSHFTIIKNVRKVSCRSSKHLTPRKKESFPWSVSSVNVTKFAISCRCGCFNWRIP